MAVTTEITRQLDNNFVQVDISSKQVPTRYFRVPKDKADSFCADYKKNNKNMGTLSNVSLVASALVTTSLAYALTKSLSKGLRTTIEIASGLAGAFCSSYLVSPILKNNSQKFLHKYNASEIHYENKKFPI